MIILVVLQSRLQVSYRTPLSGCAQDSGTGGGAAVFRWAERMGIPVRILDSPIAEASRSLGAPEGNCILTMGDGPWTPTGENLDSASWVMAREWVARGNTLVIVTANSGALPAEARKELIRRTIHETAASGSVFGLLSAVDNRVETARASVVSGGALTVAANGPRWTVSTSPGPERGRRPQAARNRPASSRRRIGCSPPMARGSVVSHPDSARGGLCVAR